MRIPVPSQFCRSGDHDNQTQVTKKPESFSAGVGRGLRQAARAPREVARMHGTSIYVWENGKVVAKKP